MRRFLGVFLVLFLSAGPALAHPHIFVDSTAQIVFDKQGRFAEIRHHWIFDKAFSAWVTQGLDTNHDGKISPDEMQDLADQNLLGLSEFDYYTFAGEGQKELIFRPVPGAHMHMENGRVALEFSIVPTKPYEIANTLEIEVSDPDYYVAFSFPDSGGASLVGAPLGCSVESHPPQPLSDADAKKLAAIGADVVAVPPELKALAESQANIILVHCPLGAKSQASAPEEPATALDAITAATRPISAPFGGPPPERNLPMPKTGFFGWINAQQKAFYIAMSQGLAAFRNDGSAFLVLGLLSFLYGVFHAAGPGHGKVVISSYMLAGERQLKSGIALSFAAALAQSLTAIIFVVIAAAVLSMTSTAMSGAAWSIEVVSYALVTGLGLWLLVRKLFGFGHHHHHHAHNHDQHGHEHHDHDHHDHAHFVVPTRGQSIREVLGLVLAVGLRPCSGALVVLVFALSQGVLLAGIGAVLLMGLGTALTVSSLAILAVGAKALALKVGSGADRAERVVSAFEIFGALLLTAFGIVMLVASFMPY